MVGSSSSGSGGHLSFLKADNGPRRLILLLQRKGKFKWNFREKWSSTYKGFRANDHCPEVCSDNTGKDQIWSS